MGTHRLVRDLVHDAGGEFFLTEVRVGSLFLAAITDVRIALKHHRFLALLLEIAKELEADIRFGCRVAQVGAEGSSVILESGETLQADVVVGADGVCGPCSSAVEPNSAVNSNEAGFMTYWYVRTAAACSRS